MLYINGERMIYLQGWNNRWLGPFWQRFSFPPYQGPVGQRALAAQVINFLPQILSARCLWCWSGRFIFVQAMLLFSMIHLCITVSKIWIVPNEVYGALPAELTLFLPVYENRKTVQLLFFSRGSAWKTLCIYIFFTS
jgi:hypothetical protein